MIYQMTRYLLAVNLIIFGIGCSKNEAGPGGAAPAGDNNIVLSQLSAGQLPGTWQAACQSDSANGFSFQDKYVFTAPNQFQLISTDYAAINCGGSPELTWEQKGNFSIDGPHPTVANASMITFSNLQVIVKPLTADAALGLNGESFCGFTDWAANVAKNIPLSNACLGGMPSSYVDFASLSSNKIYFSNEAGTAVDTSVPYTKL